MRRRRGRLFSLRYQPSAKARLSFLLGLICAASVGLVIYRTYKSQDTAAMRAVAVVLVSLVFSMTGLIVGILSCTEPDTRRLLSVLGILLNGAVVAFCFAAMYIGVVM